MNQPLSDSLTTLQSKFAGNQLLSDALTTIQNELRPFFALLDSFDPRNASTFVSEAKQLLQEIVNSGNVPDVLEGLILALPSYLRSEKQIVEEFVEELDSVLATYITELEAQIEDDLVAQTVIQNL